MTGVGDDQTYITSAGDPSSVGLPQEKADLAAGDTLGRYILLKKLGAGGMGIVYEAYDPELERKVALKRIILPTFGNESHTSFSQHAQSLLIAEAQSQAKLIHPNVVSVYDVGYSPHGVYMAMELIPGQTVATWLKQHKPHWRAAVAIFQQAAAGLAAAHDNGLVHRDFKPDNLLLGLDGRARVADFGLAEARQQTHSRQGSSDPGQMQTNVDARVAGTFSYMPPEQHRGDNVGVRSDVYAFCVSLYEAIHGVRPYHGDTREGIIAAIENRQITPPLRPVKVPLWLQAILWRGLSPQAKERYASMHELIAALEEGMARRPVARWLVSIASLIVLVTSSTFLAAEGNLRVEACQRAAAQALSFWSPAAWQAVENAFIATGLPYAQDVASTVARTVDHRLEDWSSLYLATCEREKDDSNRRALAVRCLDEQAAELAAIIEAYQRAEPSHVQNARQLLNGLEPVERCRRQSLTTYRQEIPAKPQDLPAFLTLGQDVRAAFISERLIKGENRDRELQNLIHRASSSVGTPALLARVVGKVADHAADAFAHQRARKLSDRATLLAEAADEAETTTNVLYSQVLVRGYKLADVETANELYHLAQAHLQRQGNDPLLKARVCVMSVPFLAGIDRHDQAISCLRQAVKILEHELGLRHVDTIRAFEFLAVTLAFIGSTDETQELFVKTAGLYGDVIGPSHPALANTFANLASSSMELGNLPLSLEYWTQAHWIAEQGTVPPDLVLAIYLFSANTARRSGLLQLALDNNQRCVEFARQQANPRILGCSWICRVRAALIRAEQGDLSICADLEPAIAEISSFPTFGRFRDDLKHLAYRDLSALAWKCKRSRIESVSAELARREHEALQFFGPRSPLAHTTIDDLFIENHGLEAAHDKLLQRLAWLDKDLRLADRLLRMELRLQLVDVLLGLNQGKQALNILHEDRLLRLQLYGTSMAANWRFELLLARAHLQVGSPDKALAIVNAIRDGLEEEEHTIVGDAYLWAVQARSHQAIDMTNPLIERELSQAKQLVARLGWMPPGLAGLLER